MLLMAYLHHAWAHVLLRKYIDFVSVRWSVKCTVSLSKSTLRLYVYKWTQPWCYEEEFPLDCYPMGCEVRPRNQTLKCPSSLNPHAIRPGSITNILNNDMPDKVVSDRANVSPEVIQQHYDRRLEREKMEQRRKYLDNI